MQQQRVFDVAIVGYGPSGVVAAGLLGQAKAGRVKWPCALVFGAAGLMGRKRPGKDGLGVAHPPAMPRRASSNARA